MEFLCHDDDLVWSLTGYGTHEHVLGMTLKPFEPWICPYVEPLMYGDEDIEEVYGTYDDHLSHKCVVVKFLNNDVVDLLMKTWWRKPDEGLGEEALMKTLMPLQRSWSPLLVWWHDEGTHTHVMTHLLTFDEVVGMILVL